jgi:hypothetical protein
MPYHIKDFNSWKSHNMNEGLLDTIKNVSKKFLDLMSKFKGLAWLNGKFEGAGSWFLNMYLQQKTGKIPKGIEYVPYSDTETIVNAALKEQKLEAKETEQIEESEVNEAEEGFNPRLLHDDLNMIDGDFKSVVDEIEERIIMRREGGKTQPGPIMIWGGVGIGKTGGIKSLAKKYKMDYQIVNLSQVDPDTMILPKENKETGMAGVMAGEYLPVFNTRLPNAKEIEAEKNGPLDENGKPRGGIFFIDEVTRASSEGTLNAMLSLIHDREFLNWRIPSAWIIVGAANRRQDDVTRFKESKAMYNRFLHLNYVATVEGFKEFAKEYIDEDTGELIIDPTMGEFLEFNKDLLHMYDADNDDNTQVVFPTPRTWDLGATAMYSLKKYKAMMDPPQKPTMQELERKLAMAVGKGPAKQYFAFLRLIQEIDAKALRFVYTSPEKAPLPKKEGGEYKSDSASAMVTAILMDKLGQKVTPEEMINLVKYIIRLDDPRWGVVMAQKFLKEHPYVMDNDPSSPYRKAFTFMIQEFDKHYPDFDPNNPYDDELED